MLTRLCAKLRVRYEHRENELDRERDELVRQGFAAQKRLHADQNEYNKKLDALTKTYKTVMDVSISLSVLGETNVVSADPYLTMYAPAKSV